ncbi:hypothetical protein SSPS47_04030 [Streptomyces sp. S4.7]|nr:hypothetical protein SSPS47_04030 [Streptomyces sp. S4.7]
MDRIKRMGSHGGAGSGARRCAVDGDDGTAVDGAVDRSADRSADSGRGRAAVRSSSRDESAGLLGEAVAAETTEAVIALGDPNGTVDDRGLTPLTSRLNVAERGFALSFPTAFPVARIDQVMARSATVAHIRTLRATGSDHLPVVAGITGLDRPDG